MEKKIGVEKKYCQLEHMTFSIIVQLLCTQI